MENNFFNRQTSTRRRFLRNIAATLTLCPLGFLMGAHAGLSKEANTDKVKGGQKGGAKESGATQKTTGTSGVPANGKEQAPTKRPAKNSDLKMVAADNPTAKALQYHANASEAPARTIAKSGVPAKEQYCHNCSYFTAEGKVDGQEAGRCQLISGGLVNSNGWCVSWTKKA